MTAVIDAPTDVLLNFALDKNHYQQAAVSGSNRKYYWILARKPDMPESVKANLISKVIELGSPAEELVTVDHGSTSCAS